MEEHRRTEGIPAPEPAERRSVRAAAALPEGGGSGMPDRKPTLEGSKAPGPAWTCGDTRMWLPDNLNLNVSRSSARIRLYKDSCVT